MAMLSAFELDVTEDLQILVVFAPPDDPED
jgi:hypothetical protein